MIYQKIKNIKIKFATIEAYTNLNLKINKNEINKIQHIACGNQVLKILTWNKGNSSLEILFNLDIQRKNC